MCIVSVLRAFSATWSQHTFIKCILYKPLANINHDTHLILSGKATFTEMSKRCDICCLLWIGQNSHRLVYFIYMCECVYVCVVVSLHPRQKEEWSLKRSTELKIEQVVALAGGGKPWSISPPRGNSLSQHVKKIFSSFVLILHLMIQKKKNTLGCTLQFIWPSKINSCIFGLLIKYWATTAFPIHLHRVIEK